MRNVDKQIEISNDAIVKLIDLPLREDRGFLSQNILDKLRTFIEILCVKIAGQNDYSYKIFQKIAKNNVASRGETNFLIKFHKMLQHSKSHYATDEDVSERLMLKYYEYLIRAKNLFKDLYNIEILKNLEKFPIHLDNTSEEYQRKISEKIKQLDKKAESVGRVYIQKIKPFFVDDEIFYEVTFRPAYDKLNKFDRLIAFTKSDIVSNYAANLFVREDNIEIQNKTMPISIIDDWEPSIRLCEFKNFERIFDSTAKDYNKTKEYTNLMFFLKKTRLNLVEIIDFPDSYYQKFRTLITEKEDGRIIKLLDNVRETIKKNQPGNNILRYLLYSLNNRIIREQYADYPNGKLSNLNLDCKSIPFDKMPFATFLSDHITSLSDLFNCIDAEGREHELLARRVLMNSETKGQLYTPINDLVGFSDIDNLIKKFNDTLYKNSQNQQERKLDVYGKNIFITGHENAAIEIIRILKNLSSSGIKNYSNSVNTWLSSLPKDEIDCDEKRDFLQKMFIDSKISLIYGAAGTGKTKMIEYISKYYNERSKLYLANTHSAVSNLKGRIVAQNTDFRTVKSFLMSRESEITTDVLIIDECSVISNKEMLDVLKKAKFGVLILVGDIFQIESIKFGNWFYLAKDFLSSSVIELTTPWRAKDNNNLLLLWEKVRNIDNVRNTEDDLLEHITTNKYSEELSESIFESLEEDEIILCLNYDGFYGINNINRFLQQSNKNNPIRWNNHIYKVNDPVLFNESRRFGSSIYNNLKGEIIDIEISEEKIRFDIEIEKSISELDIFGYDIDLLDSINENKSVVRFYVNKIKDRDEDDDGSASDVVPFQIAYAISIHKAQGLEYDSVKIIITNEIEEKISHNIFYTAITRAKKKLKIYCPPEPENKIFKNMKTRFNKKDINILKQKFNI